MSTAKNNDAFFDITIIGGGLTGASLALLLQQHLPEERIALIETFDLSARKKQAPPSYDDRSSALAMSSYRILASLGLLKALQPHLCAIKQVHVSDRGHPGGVLLDASDLKNFTIDDRVDETALGYVIENRCLGQVLLNAIASQPNIQVFSPATVTRLDIKSGAALLHLQETQQTTRNIHCQLAIIADGVQSSLRQQLGIGIKTQPYKQCAIIANVSPSAEHQHIAYERFTDQGPMALLPLNNFNQQPRCALVWTVPADKEQEVMALNDEDFIEAVQQRFGERLGFFRHAGQRHAYPLALSRASEQVRNHVVLMGNSAHSMHPVAGQGFNLCLRDSYVLAKILRKAKQQKKRLGDLTVLQQYVAQQQWDQDKTIQSSDGLIHLFSTNSTLPTLARTSGLLGLNFLPGLKPWFTRQATGITGNFANPAPPVRQQKQI